MTGSPLSPIEVVAFDCDGVLFDSALANQTYYNHILDHFRRPRMTKDQFQFVQMHTVHESLAFLLPDPDMAETAEKVRQAMNPIQYIRLMQEEPTLRRLLTGLKPYCKTAIATNRVDTMDMVLAVHRLTEKFDHVVTAADVNQPKPQPDQLLKLLDQFGIAPHQMVYIGDATVDADAACRAGVPFIAYRNPDLTAVEHIERLEQLLPIVRNWRK